MKGNGNNQQPPADEFEIDVLQRPYNSGYESASPQGLQAQNSRDFTRPYRPGPPVQGDASLASLPSHHWGSSTQTLTDGGMMPHAFDSQPPSPGYGWGMESGRSTPLGNRNSMMVRISKRAHPHDRNPHGNRKTR